MAEASIPVDLRNPGQVFASLGFLEAAHMLCGGAEGGFDWSDESDVKFRLRAAGDENPFAVVLQLVADAHVERIAPPGFQSAEKGEPPVESEVFPRQEGKGKERITDAVLPVALSRGPDRYPIAHWADGSGRERFKLFGGQQKGHEIGSRMRKRVSAMWCDRRDDVLANPFDVLTSPLGGTFNLDPRGNWVAIDLGYSPNEHESHSVQTSPIVELLGAWGLEHARPARDAQTMRYGVWCVELPPMLARPTLGAAELGVRIRTFRFTLRKPASGYSIVTFAQEEEKA